MVGVARDGLTLIDIAADLNPDVVSPISDAGPQRHRCGLTLLERGLCKAVVLLTMYGDQELVDGALQAGIRRVCP